MTPSARIRIHVRPQLRPIGERLFPDWLAIAIGTHVWTWRPLTPRELAHEVAHVRQWRRHGLLLPVLYLRAAWEARRAGGHWYFDNAFEREASGREPA